MAKKKRTKIESQCQAPTSESIKFLDFTNNFKKINTMHDTHGSICFHKFSFHNNVTDENVPPHQS